MKWSSSQIYGMFSDISIIVHTVFKQCLYNSNMSIFTLKKKHINVFNNFKKLDNVHFTSNGGGDRKESN